MDYSKKDIIIGFVIIVIIIAGTFLFKKYKIPAKIQVSPTPISISFKKELENNFKLNIPDNKSSVELKDVSGGDSRGLATDNEVLLDANDPVDGFFYQGWLQKGTTLVSLGKLQMAKGGWLLEYNKSKLPQAEKIIVSLEKTFDNKLETKILEGSFN